jgi:hypothetical protein
VEYLVEGFEHLVKVALEEEDFVVSGNMKFHVERLTKKSNRKETQNHGYEIDLVAANHESLVLASVKSFFGSKGVSTKGFKELIETVPTPRQLRHFDLYKIFNDSDLREKVISKAAKQFGYKSHQVELRLYVGKFQSESARNEITKYLGSIKAGKGGIRVFGLEDTLKSLFKVLENKTYFNDPVIMTLKALVEATRQASIRKGQKTNPKKSIARLAELLGVEVTSSQT